MRLKNVLMIGLFVDISVLKKFSVKKRTLPLRWISRPGPFDCRSNALSSKPRMFHTTFLTESIDASCGYG